MIDTKLKRFTITWQDRRIAESYVEATTEEEARMIAEMGYDEGYDTIDGADVFEIMNIETDEGE